MRKMPESSHDHVGLRSAPVHSLWYRDDGDVDGIRVVSENEDGELSHWFYWNRRGDCSENGTHQLDGFYFIR